MVTNTPKSLLHKTALFSLTSLCVLFLIVSIGCTTTPKKPEKTPYVFYPAPPDEPRFQFLVSYSDAKELGEKKRSGLAEHVLGTEDTEKFYEIRKPFGIAMHDGKIYVCDTRQNSVDVLDLVNRKFNFIGREAAGALRSPASVYVDDDGKKYVADVGWNRVLIFDENDQYLDAVGDPDHLKPVGVLVMDDTIVISNYLQNEIELWDKTTLKPKGALGESIGEKVEVGRPLGLAKDKDNNLYVVETAAFRVSIFDEEGHKLGSFGKVGDSFGQFARPKGIAVDREGRIYVVDAAFQNVQIFDKEGQLLTFIGEGGADPGQLSLPADIDIDYDNVDLFRKYVHPNYELEFLILVTSQFGPRKVSVYGFVKKKT